MRRQHLIILAGLLLLAAAGCGTAGEQATQRRGQAVPAAGAQPGAGGASRALDCNVTISASYAQTGSVAALAWVSHQVVAGTVIEQLPPIWVYPDPQGRPNRRQIYTDYVVRVDQRVRGVPGDTIRVRRAGGTLDGCTQQNPDEPPLAIGDQRLLFLHEFTVPNTPTPAYSVIGGPQGHWRLNADGTVIPPMPEYGPPTGLPLPQVADQIRAALAGSPPAAAPRDWLVPPDRAPVHPPAGPPRP